MRGAARRALRRGLFVLAAVAAWPMCARADEIVRVRERTMMDWNARTDGLDRRYAAAGLTVTFTFNFDARQTVTPVIHVRSADGQTIDAAGAAGFGDVARARFGIGEIDPANDLPEVAFTSYTGGAHCCTLVVILSKTPLGWRKIEIGPVDGEPLDEFPTDVDGDHVPDIVMRDGNFAYAFSAYAFSWLPPVVYQVRGGRLIEASRNPEYAPLFKADMAKARAVCLDRATPERNGACAGMVADAARLGRRDFVWRTMLANYNSADRWEYPQGCKVMLVEDECPKGEEIVFANFPDALKWFLDHNGY